MAGARRRWIILTVAVVLLAAVSVAAFVATDSGASPARAWSAWAWRVRYRVFPVEDRGTLVALHRDASRGSRGECVACHGDRVKSQLPVHRIHLQSDLLMSLACPDCHQHVDLASRGSTTPVTWVDVGFCRSCHSAFPELASEPDGHAGGIDSDCVKCHTGALAVRHAQSYLPRALPEAECKGCHGARVLPWTSRHEQDGWLSVHGAEALGAGSDRCFECHDFGLKFCDECHATKPSSHIPAEQWRVRHPDAARADTRVCYTCHDTSFCKGCHINHEAGWMTTHPGFIAEHGTASCSECHSQSSCSYCHTAVLAGSVQPTVTP
jgi:hypothetical protein